MTLGANASTNGSIQYVRALTDSACLDPHVAGSKAATLARLRLSGFSVPDGFVIPVGTLEHALRRAGIHGEPTAEQVANVEIDQNVGEAITAAARRLGGPPYAVRSSGVDEDGAESSYAGQYSTVLDVRDAELLDAVRTCWSSAMSDRVRRYRKERGAEGQEFIAVLVQRLVPAVAAGVAFTANPITGRRDEVLVSATRGLGDKLVSGEVSPDEWLIRGATVECQVGTQSALSENQVRSVAKLARRVEQEMGGPTDIEWAGSKEGLFLLQARRITTLPTPLPEPVPIPVDPPPGFWQREATHAPEPLTPATRSLLRANNEVMRAVCQEFGMLFEGVAFEEIGGWWYMRIVPLGGKDRPVPPQWVMPVLLRLVPQLRSRIRTCVGAMRRDLPWTLVDRWYAEWRPQLGQEIADLRAVNLSSLSDDALGQHLARVHTLQYEGHLIHMRLHGALAIILGELAFTCKAVLGWDEAKMFDLVSGLSALATEPAHQLAELASIARDRLPGEPTVPRLRALLHSDPRFAELFDRYQREYGCRALRYEIADATIAEKPDLVLAMLRDQISRSYDPQSEATKLEERRNRARREAHAALAGRPAEDRTEFWRVVTRAERSYPLREDNELWTVSAPNALVRWAMLEAGRRMAAKQRLDATDDVFFLEVDELKRVFASGEDVRQLVKDRKGQRHWALRNPGPASYGKDPGPPPESMLEALPPEARLAMSAFRWAIESIVGPAPSSDGATESMVRGIPGSPGRYTGKVRVVMNETEFGKIEAGDVLVCPITSPVWSIVFPSVGALVTDTGGPLSHAAIIAREYGIPAALATGNATAHLRDGQVVTVDGSTGTVTVTQDAGDMPLVATSSTGSQRTRSV